MNTNKRILVVANYPIKKPLHGGQKRTAAIVEEYRKRFSYVKFVAVFVREHYPTYDTGDIYLTGKSASEVVHDHLTSDIRIGNAMLEDTKLRKQIEKTLLAYKPDIIHVEQCFPYIGLKTILADLGLTPKIVYGSQNIETVIKEDVMTIAGAPESKIREAIKTIEALETDLAQSASLIAAVSEEDGQYYLSRGARSYILASNGILAIPTSKAAARKWQQTFEKQGVKHIALFVGSAHLPNMQGLRQMVGLRLGFFSADSRLVLAGGVGRHLKQHFDDSSILNITFWQRALSPGFLSEESLGGLIQTADVILLPIVKGGGSNLKTAEAILSGKKIVATSFAFRGYEEYLSLPNTWIADSPDEFKKAIVESFAKPLVRRNEVQENKAKMVQWSYSLKALVEGVNKL